MTSNCHVAVKISTERAFHVTHGGGFITVP
jgi:hypothetical protein